MRAPNSPETALKPAPRTGRHQHGPRPFVKGGARLAPTDLARSEKTPRPFTPAEIRFRKPVYGPLLLGSQRYLGMGLFNPIPQ
ncbi:hypothetical protein GCM10025787_03050 [Saccharopolyspora rosea]